MSELVEQSAATDAPYWAFANSLRIDGQPFDLQGRKYQLELMRPVTEDGKRKRNEVIRKGSQIGITIGKVIEITHGAIYKLYPQGIIYYFPSGKAVEHFSKTRFKPFLDDNDYVKQFVSDVNAVAVRRIAGVNVNFFGCSATTIVGGEAKDSVSVRSTPADWVLLDERTLFDDEMAKQVNQRLGNSKIERRTDLGTPKLPDSDIDLLYSKSDMRRWQIKCGACGKYTCMESEFPKSIDVDSDGRGYPCCVHCGKEIYRSSEFSSWVPDYPERETIGYWASQLLNPNKDLARILRIFDNPEAYDMDLAECYRTILGLSYVSSEDRLSESDVYGCCCGDMMAVSHAGPCAMGVDVGKTLHAVIGYKITHDRFRLVKIARLPDWNALHDIAQRFNVKSCVIDAHPELHRAREFQKAEHFAVYVCYYSEHLKTFDQWDEQDGIVKVNRTEIFDATHQMTVSPGRLMIPRNCEEVREFAHQMTMAAKVLEIDERSGGKIYRYRKIGDKEDHYRNALNYFLLACKKVGTVRSERTKPKVLTQDMEYKL
jgi:hypothetical protein